MGARRCGVRSRDFGACVCSSGARAPGLLTAPPARRGGQDDEEDVDHPSDAEVHPEGAEVALDPEPLSPGMGSEGVSSRVRDRPLPGLGFELLDRGYAPVFKLDPVRGWLPLVRDGHHDDVQRNHD